MIIDLVCTYYFDGHISCNPVWIIPVSTSCLRLISIFSSCLPITSFGTLLGRRARTSLNLGSQRIWPARRFPENLVVDIDFIVKPDKDSSFPGTTPQMCRGSDILIPSLSLVSLSPAYLLLSASV